MDEQRLRMVAMAIAESIVKEDAGNPGRWDLDYPNLIAGQIYINLELAAKAAMQAMPPRP